MNAHHSIVIHLQGGPKK